MSNDVCTPENIGRLMWWTPPEYTGGFPVRLVAYNAENMRICLESNGDIMVVKRDLAVVALLPWNWTSDAGLLRRPVTELELMEELTGRSQHHE